MIDSIQTIIQVFADKYNFIQQIDIQNIENADFDVKNYNKINGKKYIIISNNSIEIGTIFILIDTYDEGDEYYSIDTNALFSINIVDILNEDILIECMISKCKQFDLL
jgi:hypothetical protein